MIIVLLDLEIRAEPDVVRVRQQARALGALLGFDLQDQTRIATAASEVARNAYQYARGGSVQFSVEEDRPAALVIRVTDTGGGISDLAGILGGRVKSLTGLGLGLIGSRKLMGELRVDTAFGQGTTVEMKKLLPENAPKVTPEMIEQIKLELTRAGFQSPFEEVRRQNGELIRTLTEIQVHEAELARVNRSLRDRVEFEQQMVGIVSHDLRNPLSAILVSANLLLRFGNLDVMQTRNIGRVVTSAMRAERMIRDLLDFTQARMGGGIPVQRTTVDLHLLVQQVVEELSSAHPKSEIRLVQTGSGTGEWDSDRIAQVLTNLVRNAIHYSAPHTPVTIESRGLSDPLVLTVHNEGPPITAEAHGGLFHPMRRGNDIAQRGRDGLGLGLFIVQQIVAAHEGLVSCHSAAGVGTTFTVTLPRRRLLDELPLGPSLIPLVPGLVIRAGELDRAGRIDDSLLTRFR
jgi:signal transduction histidine kinase